MDPLPPLTRFTSFIRQVDLSNVDARTRTVFNHFFPEFLRIGSRHHFSQMAGRIIDGHSVRYGGRGRERRFAGDPSLPRNRYWIVEDTRPNRHRNHLLNELFAYASPWVRVRVKMLDTRLDRRQAKNWLQLTHSTVHGESLLQLILPHFPGQLPLGLGIDGSTLTLMQYPVLRLKIDVDGVLDLRQPPSQDWVVAFLCQRSPDLAEALKKLTHAKQRGMRWLHALRLLLAQDLGGGHLITQALGYELRQLGAAGLVFPPARSDSQVIMRDGEMLEHMGFNFVDYRGSQPLSRTAPEAWTWGLPVYPSALKLLTASSRRCAGSWEVCGLQQINGERYQTSWIALGRIAENMMTDLCSGKVHPSDYCGNHFQQLGMMSDLVDHKEDVATIGRFLIPFTPRRPRTRYGDIEYKSPTWFFIRRGESGKVRLECVRCLREIVCKKWQRPPMRCPNCGLGERTSPTEWWPKNSGPINRTKETKQLSRACHVQL